MPYISQSQIGPKGDGGCPDNRTDALQDDAAPARKREKAVKLKSSTDCCMITLASIERGLLLADCQVEATERHVASQREIVGALEEVGGDPRVARNLLNTFEDLQAFHIKNRDRLWEMKTEVETMALQRLLINQRLGRLGRYR